MVVLLEAVSPRRWKIISRTNMWSQMKMVALQIQVYSENGTITQRRIVYWLVLTHSNSRRVITFDSNVISVYALADVNRSIAVDTMHSENVDDDVRSVTQTAHQPVFRYQDKTV